MGKEKKRKSEGGDDNKQQEWETLVSRVTTISKPLASRKLSKKLYKCMKNAQEKKCLRKGVREVQKFLKRGEKGFVVLAGDTNPIDVICHVPIMCEEKSIPYCYTPSKQHIGNAYGSMRSTCMVLVKSHEDYEELFDQCFADLKAMPMPL
ncbi:hypothetical protein CAPTEDRAFT_172931 [Capitella teleta]|uniref:H/ACA ribonucleoprotein complex subunit 2 n=1 Tax=Capitella teleta TaxID=283909 RepID=R7V0U0_CAPTE|nr:hypothetical protein CAPTEDRAFT_172931 [Capitella teleta]|eukprot:ELU09832.1 hypothetical protein CAPTEDRAFT_172931 [Capitella teleta]